MEVARNKPCERAGGEHCNGSAKVMQECVCDCVYGDRLSSSEVEGIYPKDQDEKRRGSRVS
jgi:hypothetical protein